MEKTEDSIRTIRLKRREFTHFDALAILFLGLGLFLLIIFLFTRDKSQFDIIVIPVFLIVLMWIGYRFYKSLLTTETYRIGNEYIEIESIFRNNSKTTKVRITEIQSIELYRTGLLSFFPLQYVDIMIIMRIAASLGGYYVPIIDCGSRYIFVAQYYNKRTRKWITDELIKEMNYSP